MNTEIRELNVAELDQVSGGMFPGWTPELAKAMNNIIFEITVKEVFGAKGGGAGPAGGGKGGAGPVPV